MRLSALKTINFKYFFTVLLAAVILTGLMVGTSLTAIRSTVPKNNNLINIVSVQTGRNYVVALSDTGEVYTKGINAHGELGANTGEQSVSDWTKVNIAEKVKTINATASHTLALTESGHLFTWGENDYGQLGSSNTVDAYAPTQVTAGLRYTDLALGNNFVVAIDEQHRLFTWGENESGQLGTGDHETKTTPVHITLPGNAIPVQVFAGNGFALAIDDRGRGYSWGDNSAGQLGTGNNDSQLVPTAIKTNQLWKSFSTNPQAKTVLAINTNNALYSWGNNDNGQLGNGVDWRQQQLDENARVEAEKKRIQNADEARKTALITQCVDAKLEERRKAYDEAQKKDDDSQTTVSPSPMPSPTPSVSPSASPTDSPAQPFQDDSNKPLTEREGYQECKASVEATFQPTDVSGLVPRTITEPALAGNANTPTFIYTAYGISSVEVGVQNSYAIDRLGHLFAWGKDGKGQTGLNISDDNSHTQVPLKVYDNVTAVETGDGYTLAITKANKLIGWGDNSKDILLRGSEDPVLTPQEIMADVKKVTVYAHSVIITQGNEAKGWGDNSNNRLALDSTDNYITQPAVISTKLNYYALTDTGGVGRDGANTFAYWGTNTQNIFGLNDTGLSSSTVTMRTIDTFSSAYAGNKYSIAWDAEGHSWGWGENHNGKLLPSGASSLTRPTIIDAPASDITRSTLGGMVSYSAANQTITLWGGLQGSAQIPDVQDIAVSTSTLFVLQKDGKVLISGYRDGALEFKQLNDLTYSHVSAGGNLSVLVRSDGKFELYGYHNLQTQLGETDDSMFDSIWKNEVKDVSVSNNLVTIVDNNGLVWSLGYSPYGVFGDASSSRNLQILPVVELGK